MIVLSLVGCLSQVAGQTPSFQIAFWNVENLFDTTNTENIRDDDFTPSGRYEWTEARLTKKLHDLSQVIKDIHRSEKLAILGLSEIENREILDRLNDDHLRMNYAVVHKESPDERGIDCALLYDPNTFSLYQRSFIPVYLGGDEKTRDILEAEFKYRSDADGKSLYVFVNHWPSRWGGQAKTDPLRRRAASTLRDRIDQILMQDPAADILIMGDLNDNPQDPSVAEILLANKLAPQTTPGSLINTMWDIHEDPEQGSYKYQGEWGCIDQVIISRGLLDEAGFNWALKSTAVFRPDYLLESDGDYAGWPYRMFRGGAYQGGYSDHLPVTCKLSYVGR